MTAKPKANYRISIIPARAVVDERISAQALRVLALLGRHTDENGWCRRSQVRMAEEMKCGRATIQRSLEELAYAGYVEKREETRQGVDFAEGRHPHCSFSYRVRLDLADDVEDAAGAHGRAGVVPNDGHQVPSQDGHGVPISRAPLTEPSLNERPLSNPLARENAREGGEVISVGKAATDRFQEFVDTVAQTWPGGFPKDNLTASSTAWDRETRLHDPTLILECSRLHGREKMKLADARSPSQGKLLLTKPSRWLQSGAWKGYVQEHAQQRERESRLVTAMGNVQRGLGAELFQMFRERFNFSDDGLAAMDGVEFVPGNPALFKCQNFGTVAVLEKRLFELQRLLECEVMVRRVPAVKVG